MSDLSGWPGGRLFKVPGGNGETAVVCPFEFEPAYATWRCVVIEGSEMYPQGGYNIIVPQKELKDENEMVPVPRHVKNSWQGTQS